MATTKLRKIVSKDLLDFLEREHIASVEEIKQREGERWIFAKGVYDCGYGRII